MRLGLSNFRPRSDLGWRRKRMQLQRVRSEIGLFVSRNGYQRFERDGRRHGVTCSRNSVTTMPSGDVSVRTSCSRPAFRPPEVNTMMPLPDGPG